MIATLDLQVEHLQCVKVCPIWTSILMIYNTSETARGR